jgi:uncharacterized membrane protein
MIRLDRVIETVSSTSLLDAPAELVARIGHGLPARIAKRSQDLLGHPLHPALTDLPIGFWTSAWTLDLLPSRNRTEGAARTLIGLGLLSTVPTVVSGFGDAAGMSRGGRRTAAMHAALNVGATAAQAWSWWLRRGGTSPKARAVGQLGAVLATAAAAVGGHLAFPPDDESSQVDGPVNRPVTSAATGPDGDPAAAWVSGN